MILLVKTEDYLPENRPVRVPVGIFTQKQYAYKAIAILEKKATDVDEAQACIKMDLDGLYLTPEGKSLMNYFRLCAQMRDNAKAAIYDGEGNVEYVMWDFDVNVMPTVENSPVAETVAENTDPADEDPVNTVPAEPASENPTVAVEQPTLL